MNSSIIKNTVSNQQKLLLINSLESPSYKEWQSMQRKVFHASSQEQVNFKTKLRNYELPAYKYGKKPFGRKLLSRQRLKNIYKLSDSSLKNILSRVNRSSSKELMWELIKKEYSSKEKTHLSFSSNRDVLQRKISISKSLSLYGMTLYLRKLSQNLVYLNSWDLKNSNKTVYSKEYSNLLLLMKNLENILFIKTCTSFKVKKELLADKNVKKLHQNIVQINSVDENLVQTLSYLSSIEEGLKNNLLKFIKDSNLSFKSSKDLDYFKVLMKNKAYNDSETIHKNLLCYIRTIRNLLTLSYDPEYNWLSKSSPHLVKDFSTMNLSMNKHKLILSADQEQVCEDLVSFTKTR
tara:strand:+ start:242 stop:1288 length:1047 start_codon:yes stop_codon:yes gene_type:complete